MFIELRIVLCGGQLRLQVIHEHTQFGGGGGVSGVENVDFVVFDESLDM